MHFTLFGIILPTIKLKVYTFLGLMNSATKVGLCHGIRAIMATTLLKFLPTR